jgi:hypothetical protein
MLLERRGCCWWWATWRGAHLSQWRDWCQRKLYYISARVSLRYITFCVLQEDICAVGNETNCGRTFVTAAHKTSSEIYFGRLSISLWARIVQLCAQQQLAHFEVSALCTQLRKCVFAHHCAPVEWVLMGVCVLLVMFIYARRRVEMTRRDIKMTSTSVRHIWKALQPAF